MEENDGANLEGETPSPETPTSTLIFAWDYSGSTSSMAYYHSVGGKYLEQFLTRTETPLYKNSERKPIYLTWSDVCPNPVSVSRMREIISRKEGSGGTNPSTIIHWIKKNLPASTPIELWLVTDGEISTFEVELCSQLNQEMNYSSINFIIISQQMRINMSVGAAFFSGSELKIFINDQLAKEGNTSKPFDYEKINISNFEQTLEELSVYVQAKFMGTKIQGLEEVDKLNKLRWRLIREIDEQKESSETATDWNWKDKSWMIKLFKGTKYYKTLTNSNVMEIRTKVDSAISTLINYIHSKDKSYQFFDILKMHFKQQKAGIVPEVEPDLDSVADVDKCTFFDAVTLETEESTPVLLLNVCDLIENYWMKGNYNKFRRVADCPLFGEFGDCVGHVFGLETVKQLYHNENGDNSIRNPMTNQPCFGGLILLPSFDKWNDYLLMKTFFQGKNIHTCHALFYYRIFKYAQTKEWISPEVCQLLENYALRRMSTCSVRLAFGSLALDPEEIVPLPLALFYCSEGSSILFGENAALFMNERLRQFFPVSADFLEIMEKLGVDHNPQFISERVSLFKIVSKLKTIGSSMDKKYWLISQCFEIEGDFITSIVKKGSFLQFLPLLNYTHKELIPFKLPTSNVNEHCLVCYEYQEGSDTTVPIMKATMRPQFAVKEEDKIIPNYKKILDCMSELKLDSTTGKIVDTTNPKKLDQTKLLSLNKMFINCTIENGKFPSLEEFEGYVWKYKRFCGVDKVRLFSPMTRPWISQVFEMYQNEIGDISVEEFMKKAKTSAEVVSRLKMEGEEDEKVAELANPRFVQECRSSWLVM